VIGTDIGVSAVHEERQVSMRTTTLTMMGLAATLVVAACKPGAQVATATFDGDLQRDLSLAEAAQPGSLTLPGTERERTQVVSAVELAPQGTRTPTRAAPNRRPSRAKVVRPARRVAPPAAAATRAPEPVVEVAVAEPAPAEVEAPAPAAAEPVIENPRPQPAPGEDAGPRERGGSGGWGGVVIRGGGVDGDHCERDLPGGRGVGTIISINVRGPMGRPTFPRY
jgi:hypothetical protein